MGQASRLCEDGLDRSLTALMHNALRVKITLRARFMKIGVWFQNIMMMADSRAEIWIDLLLERYSKT